jgi:hypothetical protein
VSGFTDMQNEQRRQRDRQAQTDRRVAKMADSDVMIDSVRRLILRSPAGTYFSLAVADDGSLSTVNLGTSL